jgi:hypothetical protein
MVLRPKPRNRRSDFEAQITKLKLPVLRPKPGNPPPPWFWGSTKKPITGFDTKPGETVATSLETKLEKTIATGFEAKLAKIVAAGFVAKPLETVTVGFEAKPPETVTTGFEAKPVKTVRVVLRPNHSQTIAINFEAKPMRNHPSGFMVKPLKTVDLGFKAQPGNPHSPSPRVRCRPHMAPPDQCDHPQSSAPGHLLLRWYSSLHAMPHLPPAHHKTSKHDSLNKTKVAAKSMTHHNQTKEWTTWFLNLPLDESIDNKSTKFEVQI